MSRKISDGVLGGTGGAGGGFRASVPGDTPSVGISWNLTIPTTKHTTVPSVIDANKANTIIRKAG